MHLGATKIADGDRQHLFDAVDHVDKRFFQGNQFIAGTEQPTLADISFLTSIANFVVSKLKLAESVKIYLRAERIFTRTIFYILLSFI